MKNKYRNVLFVSLMLISFISVANEKLPSADLQDSSKNIDNSKSQSLLKKKAEAYGLIVGHYASTLQVIETCGKYPNLKSESEETSRLYIRENHDAFLKVTSAFERDYEKEKGLDALHELQKKMVDLTAGRMQSVDPIIVETTSSEEKCSVIMSNLRRGYWDIKTKRADAVKLILGNGNTPSAGITTKSNLAGKTVPVGSVMAWRTLKLGMNESGVRKLLGEPENVEVISDFAKWEYSNNGGIVFDSQSMTVKAWKEPAFPKKDAVRFGTPWDEYVTDNAGDIARQAKRDRLNNQSLYRSIIQKMGLDSSK